MLVYDVTDLQSFDSIKNWMLQIKQVAWAVDWATLHLRATGGAVCVCVSVCQF